jgi:hypothetical protein
MPSLHRRFSMTLALMAILHAVPAFSQPTGRISGVVRDSSGAAVPGATLTVTNQATGATQTATSSSDGSYTVSACPETGSRRADD